MKNKSLFYKSMILILIPMVLISWGLIVGSKIVIEDYFKRDSFEILNREIDQGESKVIALYLDSIRTQRPGQTPGGHGLPWSQTLEPKKSVQNSLLLKVSDNEFKVLGDKSSVEAFHLERINGNQKWPLHGEADLDGETVFYAINPIDNLGRIDISEEAEVYHIAYISERYSGALSQKVISIFILAILVFISLVTLVLYYVFKRIKDRVMDLEVGAKRIGHGDFSYHIESEPQDELGRLGLAMNRMSRQLSLIQEDQADQFQMISHELKTPIMVMQGYLDALIHGQYPNGTPEASYQVLNSELNKLERLTQDIIILNKLEYLAKNKVSMEDLSIRSLFQEAISRMNIEGKIEITVNGDIILIGDKESWMRVIENILSNNMRYADTWIRVTLGPNIEVVNDGPTIDDGLLKKIMKPFVKGKEGGSGLGLTIIRNILTLYHYDFKIENREQGVAYIISPKDEGKEV